MASHDGVVVLLVLVVVLLLFLVVVVAVVEVALLFHCIMFSRLHSSDASNLVGTIPQRASRKSLGCTSRIMIGTRSMMRSRDELLQMLAKHSMHASTLSEPHGYGWLRMSEDRWCRAHERDIDDHIIMMIMRVVGGAIFIFRHNVNGVARTKIWRLNPGKKGGRVMG